MQLSSLRTAFKKYVGEIITDEYSHQAGKVSRLSEKKQRKSLGFNYY
jgi:hypothetical protein